MFTKAKIPVDDSLREWTDTRLDWLKEKLGEESLSKPMIEPTEEFFPFNWKTDAESLVNLLGTLAAYAGIDIERLAIAPVEPTGEAPPPAVIKQGGKLVLPIETSELRDINVASSILIRKLMLIKLRDAGIKDSENDLPLLTDLAAVYLGLGIFCANSATPQAPR